MGYTFSVGHIPLKKYTVCGGWMETRLRRRRHKDITPARDGARTDYRSRNNNNNNHIGKETEKLLPHIT